MKAGEISAEEFDKIDRIDYVRPFTECMALAEHILRDGSISATSTALAPPSL